MLFPSVFADNTLIILCCIVDNVVDGLKFFTITLMNHGFASQSKANSDLLIEHYYSEVAQECPIVCNIPASGMVTKTIVAIPTKIVTIPTHSL